MSRVQVPVVLTVAGSDSGGGAGIQADLKTFEAHGCFGTSAITAITAQNTLGVRAVETISPAVVCAQMEAVLEDFPVGAAKTGMLATAAIIEVVAAALAAPADRVPLVVDPVMVATSGAVLLEPDARGALVEQLIPLAWLVTPNLPEAELLSGIVLNDDESAVRAAQWFLDRGARAVLLKGGHGAGATVVDLLVERGGGVTRIERARLASRNTHGTGCTLSAAIAARLASGETLAAAVERSIDYVRGAIERAPELGAGYGPLGFRGA